VEPECFLISSNLARIKMSCPIPLAGTSGLRPKRAWLGSPASDEFFENDPQVAKPKHSRHFAIAKFGSSLKPDQTMRHTTGMQHGPLQLFE
jgi:hypothetical protein